MTPLETRTARTPEPVPSVASVERVREGGSERRGLVGLDRNERVGPLPEWFVEELRRELTSDLLITYPAADELYAEVAAALGLPEEQVLVTSGNDPVIKALYHAYVREGDGVVMLDPSYAMYAVYARMFGALAVPIGFDRELQVDADALVESIRPGVRLVLLANPNQPTGTVLPEELVREVLVRAGEAGAVVLADEAYGYFAPDTTALPLIAEHPNLVVARSFSKAGFAGIRIGFAAGGVDVMRTLFKVRSAAEVNALAIACARKLLAHPEIGEDYAAEVAAGRELLAARARSLGLEPLPSHANFLQLRLPDGLEPREVVDALRQRGWLIKGPFRDACLAGCVRVTLGPPALMAEFADVLADVVAERA
jgi:histidinol-phosphate aminotransferase